MSAQSSTDGPSNSEWCLAERNHPLSKLQGYKAFNPEDAQIKMRETVKELKVFLSKPPSASDSELDRLARERAREIMKSYD